MLYTRYVILLITLLFGLSFSLGVTAAHFGREGLNIAFVVSMFVTVVVVLVLRAILDKQVN